MNIPGQPASNYLSFSGAFKQTVQIINKIEADQDDNERDEVKKLAVEKPLGQRTQRIWREYMVRGIERLLEKSIGKTLDSGNVFGTTNVEVMTDL